jgi:hypothetical protein
MRASLRDYVAAYNTLSSLKKTEDSMAESGGSLDSTVVATTENSEEVFAAFEIQSKEFQNVQLDFENYMELLKEDIDVKAQTFEHIDYYDALLRDGASKEIAVAASEVHDLDSRRKPLITVNALFAKTSDLPPTPSVEEIIHTHISLNLPAIAKNTLQELEADLNMSQQESEVNSESSESNSESESDTEVDNAELENQESDAATGAIAEETEVEVSELEAVDSQEIAEEEVEEEVEEDEEEVEEDEEEVEEDEEEVEEDEVEEDEEDLEEDDEEEEDEEEEDEDDEEEEDEDDEEEEDEEGEEDEEDEEDEDEER